MGFILGMLPALIVLGILIFIHEFGHFLACRMTGVKVDKFSIGFGPEIVKIQGPETRYAISLIPLGGFVKPSGETAEEVGPEGLKPYDFMAKGTGVRFFIAFAGILMNFLLAYALFAGVYMIGKPVLKSMIGGFVEGYPAQGSGLAAGDEVLAVNGAEVRNWKELTDRINGLGGEKVSLAVSRAGERLNVDIAPKIEEVRDVFGKAHRLARIGILPPEEFTVEKYPPVRACAEAGRTLFSFSATTFKAIGYLATGRLSLKAVSGPIGIFSITNKTAKMGMVHILQLTAFLSASLAVFNVLPFPPLDGGMLLFITLEAVRRKRVSPKFQDAVTRAGFVILIALMVVVMVNDIANLEIVGKLKNIIQR
jgi:regulator of sigma E protease